MTPNNVVAAGNNVNRAMVDMITGYWVSQTIRAVADLSLADHLCERPLTATEIALREDSAVDTTLRLLRAARGLGLVTVDSNGRFHGTELLATLRKDTPDSLRPFAMCFTSRPIWMGWLGLVPSIRHGQTQISNVLGTDFFSYLAQNPDAARDFSAAMASATSVWMPDVAKMIDTTGVRCAVDVGGANGTLLRILQQANPALHGVVFDRPNVVEHAQIELTRSGFPDRTKVAHGDFFRAVPAGDLYLLKTILHDWSDDQCIQILGRCRAAMAPEGRIAIIEIVLEGDGDSGKVAALADLNMLAFLPGRERSLEEFDTLLSSAGLRRIAIRPTASPQSIIEAVAA
jgi:hypothetical protein